MIKAYPHLKQAGTAEARELEDRVKSHLGSHLFFDRGRVDIEEMREMLINGTFDQASTSSDEQ
jgi:hypothetical protein